MLNKLGNLHLYTFLLIISFNSSLAGQSKPLPDNCKINCLSEYGQVLGISRSGVKAYSNCQSDCVIYEPHQWKGTYTGIKWQCVEYARRWLLINKGLVYGDVDIAADIWTKISSLTEVSTNKLHPLASYLNGSKQAPAVGDLLIYSQEFNKTGHVAIVTHVDTSNGFIDVAEQNFSNKTWPDNYARRIELINKDGAYWLLDQYLLGWKHISN